MRPEELIHQLQDLRRFINNGVSREVAASLVTDLIGLLITDGLDAEDARRAVNREIDLIVASRIAPAGATSVERG